MAAGSGRYYIRDNEMMQQVLDEERARMELHRRARIRNAWYQQCAQLYDRYRKDFPNARVINEWGRNGTTTPLHIQLPNGMRIPFPPLPEELR